MTTTIIKHLIKLPAAGKGVLLWIAAEGQQVDAGQQIARFMVGNVEHRVDASGTGQLTRTTPDNITLVGASVIGWVNEGVTGTAAAASQKPLQSPVRPAPIPEGKPTSKPAAPESRQQVQTVEPITATNPRARRNVHVEPPSVEASITVLESGRAEKGGKGRNKKHRTKHTVYHVTEDQEGRVKSLSFLYKTDSEEPNYSESEIVRAAIEHLLSQDKATQKAILSYNRDREKRVGYGAGWKRPGKR
jgi:pyruvate/2-oxoglutarate dehydrogenase complex dihydrolipoamide acyltransferase (E2) component